MIYFFLLLPFQKSYLAVEWGPYFWQKQKVEKKKKKLSSTLVLWEWLTASLSSLYIIIRQLPLCVSSLPFRYPQIQVNTTLLHPHFKLNVNYHGTFKIIRVQFSWSKDQHKEMCELNTRDYRNFFTLVPTIMTNISTEICKKNLLIFNPYSQYAFQDTHSVFWRGNGLLLVVVNLICPVGGMDCEQKVLMVDWHSPGQLAHSGLDWVTD